MKKQTKDSKQMLFEMMHKVGRMPLKEWTHDESGEPALDNNEKEIYQNAKDFYYKSLGDMHNKIEKISNLNWENLKEPIKILRKIVSEFEAKSEYFHYIAEIPIEKTYQDLLNLKQNFDNKYNEINQL